jgi:hypothetical protein
VSGISRFLLTVSMTRYDEGRKNGASHHELHAVNCRSTGIAIGAAGLKFHSVRGKRVAMVLRELSDGFKRRKSKHGHRNSLFSWWSG